MNFNSWKIFSMPRSLCKENFKEMKIGLEGSQTTADDKRMINRDFETPVFADRTCDFYK